MIVKAIDDITKWTQENICAGLSFKVPPKDENTRNYDFELAEPMALPMYIPSEERTPNKKVPYPSVCVQFISGGISDNEDTLKFRFNFSTWNPGNHNQDNITNVGSNEYERQTSKGEFMANSDGWRDVWNFTDKAREKLLINTLISGMEIDHNSIQYGVYKEQDAIVDAYPYYFSWLEFEVKHKQNVKGYDIANLL